MMRIMIGVLVLAWAGIAVARAQVQSQLVSDANSAAFHGARVLTPSGVPGRAGMIAGAPYPSTSGGTIASIVSAGYSMGWICSGAGVGSITLTDGSVLPYAWTVASGMQRDAYAILDAEPGSASGCVFAVLR